MSKLRGWGRRIWWSRYAILTIITPLLIVVASMAAPSLLQGILLLRLPHRINLAQDSENSADVATALGQVDTTPLLEDLAWLTWISSMVVALGIAIYRIIQLHGAVRMDGEKGTPSKALSRETLPPNATDSQNDTSSLDDQAEDTRREERPEQSEESENVSTTENAAWSIDRLRLFWDQDSIGWPLVPTLVWLAASLPYPYTAANATIGDLQAVESNVDVEPIWQAAYAGMGIGLLAGAGSLFLLSLLRDLLMRGQSPGCGLFYGEGMAHWVLNLWSKDTPQPQRRLSRIRIPIHITGLTDPASKRLLPGHSQLLVALIASVLVYLVWYWRSLTDQTWKPSEWSIGFYLLLLIYCMCAIGSLLAFLFDRYRVPVLLVSVLYVAFFSDAQRYFELEADRQSFKLAGVPTDTGHVFLDALAARPQEPKDYPQPPYLCELYADHYEFPKWADGRRTMVVVTASGGGIQAASWTAKVLTGLEERFPLIAESIGLISGVSGGSVGVMHYLAHKQARANDGELSSWQPTPPALLQEINQDSSASSLEAVGWGIAFPDFARTVSPFELNQEIDRGWALEASWWNRLGREPADAKWMRELRIRDLIQPTLDGKIPPVIFNATAVETGQRVLISTVRADAVRPATSKTADYQQLNTPIDFLDFYGQAFEDQNIVNPRLTTAVRLSATFAYVTPVARPFPSRELSDASSDTSAEYLKRFDMHLCDGGYADNTGLVAAIRVVHDLVAFYRKRAKDGHPLPFERVIFIRIEPFPNSVAKVVKDNHGLQSAFLGPLTALTATRSSTQAERADLELSLLMDLSNQDSASAQADVSGLLAQSIERLQRSTERSAEALDDEEFSRLRSAVESLKNTSFTPLNRRDRLALQRQVNVVQTEISRVKGQAKDSSAVVEELEQAVKSYQSAKQRAEAVPEDSVEIKAFLFRFNTGMDRTAESEPGQNHRRASDCHGPD